MAEWTYDPEDYARTRRINVGGVTEDGGEAELAEDGMYHWTRTRTGEESKVVAVSLGFSPDRLKWCYRSAVKENFPLTVPVPMGIEELVVNGPEDLEPEPEEAPF